VRKRTVRNVNMVRIRAIRGPIGYFRPARGRRLRAIIAYNWNWTPYWAFGPVYCTQQNRGVTRGMTLRAIPAARSNLPFRCLSHRRIAGEQPGPADCVQDATVRFRTDGPSDPKCRPPYQRAFSPRWIGPCRANVRSIWMRRYRTPRFRRLPRSSAKKRHGRAATRPR
jgi:hypothetical protein